MGLLGQGAVAIWHDVASAGREQFYDWHGHEHMPERVGIPGFLRGRRYIGIDADREFFNLYETMSSATVSSTDYQDRLNNPTPWTVSSVKHFERVARGLCSVQASDGPGQGGLIATWRYAIDDKADESDPSDLHVAAMVPLLAALREQHTGIAATHLLLTDEQASRVDTAERQARKDPNEIPEWILLVEGWGDEEDFMHHCKRHLSDRVLQEHNAGVTIVREFYRLQATALAPQLLAGNG